MIARAKVPTARWAIRALGAWGLLLATAAAYGDELYYHIAADCGLDGGGVRLVPSGIYNTRGKPTLGECTFGSNQSIRVKLGEHPNWYRDTDVWISVWVNQSKILSRQSIDCSDTGPCSLYLEASDDTVSICNRRVGGEGPHDGSTDLGTDYRCQAVSVERLPSVRDLAEYPLHGPDHDSRAGEVRLFFSSQDRFCGQFVSDGEYVEPDGLIKPEPVATTHRFRRLVVDVDNDGVDDDLVVARIHAAGIDRNVLFVLGASSEASPSWPDVDLDALDRDREHVLPNQWAHCSRPDRCAYDDFDNMVLMAPESQTLRLPVLNARYLDAELFIFEGNTYLGVESTQQAWNHLKVIVKPLPDGRGKHMCYFQTIRPNF